MPGDCPQKQVIYKALLRLGLKEQAEAISLLEDVFPKKGKEEGAVFFTTEDGHDSVAIRKAWSQKS